MMRRQNAACHASVADLETKFSESGWQPTVRQAFKSDSFRQRHRDDPAIVCLDKRAKRIKQISPLFGRVTMGAATVVAPAFIAALKRWHFSGPAKPEGERRPGRGRGPSPRKCRPGFQTAPAWTGQRKAAFRRHRIT